MLSGAKHLAPAKVCCSVTSLCLRQVGRQILRLRFKMTSHKTNRDGVLLPRLVILATVNNRGKNRKRSCRRFPPPTRHADFFSPPYYSTALGTDLGISFMHDLLDTRRCVSILLAQLWQSI